MYPHNQVRIKKANQAGKNYVGIAALNNTCHGIANMVDVRFKTFFDFNIDGITKKDVIKRDGQGNEYLQVDPTYSPFDGSRISKTLSMFVGASADNAKQMLLGLLNTNPTTANIVMGMLRIGIPVRTVCYMMKTPVVQDMIDEAESTGRFFDEVIMNSKISQMDDENASSYKIEGFEGGNMYKYIHGQLSKKEQGSLDKAIVTFLKNMVGYSRSISDLNALLSLNSTKNAAGPTVYDTLAKWFKISQFADRTILNHTNFDGELWNRIIENVPFIRTLFDTYDKYAIGICKQISPICNDESTKQVIYQLKVYESQSNIMSEDNLKKLINGYMLYRASKLGVIKTDIESRRDWLYGFPMRFMKDQSRFGDNAFLSTLEVSDKMNRKNRIPNIKLDMQGQNKDAVDYLQASWNQIVSMSPTNPDSQEMRKLSENIISYFSMRFGYMWQPNSAMNVAPNEAKNKFDGYSMIFQAEATPGWTDIDTRNVIRQFARNNPDCGLWFDVKQIKEYKGKTFVKYTDWSERKFGYKLKNNLYLSKDNASQKQIDGELWVEVVPVTRLGIDKNFMEYDSSERTKPIQTAISEQERQKASDEYTAFTDILNMQQQNENEEYQDPDEESYSDDNDGFVP